MVVLDLLECTPGRCLYDFALDIGRNTNDVVLLDRAWDGQHADIPVLVVLVDVVMIHAMCVFLENLKKLRRPELGLHSVGSCRWDCVERAMRTWEEIPFEVKLTRRGGCFDQ